MPLVKYTANADRRNGTGRIRLKRDDSGVERVLDLGGSALEVSDEELAALQGRYQIEEVDEENAGASVSPALLGRPDLAPVMPIPQEQEASDQAPPAPTDATTETAIDHSGEAGTHEGSF